MEWFKELWTGESIPINDVSQGTIYSIDAIIYHVVHGRKIELNDRTYSKYDNLTHKGKINCSFPFFRGRKITFSQYFYVTYGLSKS